MDRTRNEKLFKSFFGFFAYSSIVLLFLITLFIIYKGTLPFLQNNSNGDVGFFGFLIGNSWNPGSEIYGIGYMILGTIFSMLLSILLALPLSLLAAIGLVEFVPKKAYGFIMGAIELLAGIPSIIFGIFGIAIIVPWLANLPFNPYPQGQSLLAVSLVLAIMILPTIIAVTTSSLRAVPEYYKEASLGLGATKTETMFKVMLPAAKSGILAAVVLGIGRAIGETMAVMMIAGNVNGGFNFLDGGIFGFLFQPIRPLTANIALDMSYATGLHSQLLFSTALVLFIFIFVLNIFMQYLIKGGKNAK